jgi:hypothetical protein
MKAVILLQDNNVAKVEQILYQYGKLRRASAVGKWRGLSQVSRVLDTSRFQAQKCGL